MNERESMSNEVIKSFLAGPKSVAAVKQQLAKGKHTIVIMGVGWSYVCDVNPKLAGEKEAHKQALHMVNHHCLDENGPKYPLPVSPDSKCERFAWLWFRAGDTVEKPTIAGTTDIMPQGKPINIDGIDVYLRERD
jgi:hypothetical protein